MNTIAALAALLVGFVCAQGEDSAKKYLRQGLEAELIAGKSATAQKVFALCRKTAKPGSETDRDCKLYSEMFGKERPKEAGPKKARELFAAGVGFYRQGQTAEADRQWHACLDFSKPGTLGHNRCMAAIELVASPSPLQPRDEGEAQKHYEAALTSYLRGDFVGARRETEACILNSAGGVAGRDCVKLLEKLDADKR